MTPDDTLRDAWRLLSAKGRAALRRHKRPLRCTSVPGWSYWPHLDVVARDGTIVAGGAA